MAVGSRARIDSRRPDLDGPRFPRRPPRQEGADVRRPAGPLPMDNTQAPVGLLELRAARSLGPLLLRAGILDLPRSYE